MDRWLKNRKNVRVTATLGSVALIGLSGLAACHFGLLSSSLFCQLAGAAGVGAPGSPTGPGVRNAPGGPNLGPAGAKGPAKPVVTGIKASLPKSLQASIPVDARYTPFTPLKNIALHYVETHPYLPALPEVSLIRLRGQGPEVTTEPVVETTVSTSPYQVSGILNSGAIKAILTNAGRESVVSPGDHLDDESAEVVSISYDGVTVRTLTKPYQLIKLDMATDTTAGASNLGGGAGQMPGQGFGPSTGGRPGGFGRGGFGAPGNMGGRFPGMGGQFGGMRQGGPINYGNSSE